MKRLLLLTGLLVLAGCHSAEEAKNVTIPDKPRLVVTSASFKDGETFGRQFIADGGNQSPQLSWSGAPKSAKSAAIFCEDPDAPSAHPYVHWMVVGLPADGSISAGETPKGTVGKNDSGTVAYFGPQPPKGKPHHYHFRVYALDAVPSLNAGFGRDELLSFVAAHVVAEGEIVGIYES